MLTTAALALALIHFGTPLAYHTYLKTKWLNKPWDVRRDPGYKPKVTVILQRGRTQVQENILAST